MKKMMVWAMGVAAVCTAAVAQDSVTPAIRDVPYWLSYFDARRAAAEKELFFCQLNTPSQSVTV